MNSLRVKRLEGMAMKLEHPVYGVCIRLGWNTICTLYVVQSFVTPLKVSQARLQQPGAPTSIRFKYVSVFHVHARRILYAHRFSSWRVQTELRILV